MTLTTTPFINSLPTPPQSEFKLASAPKSVPNMSIEEGFTGLSGPQDTVKRVEYERKLGDSETSYFLPSRASGVNDMYLHLGFKAPEHLATRARVSAVWAIMRVRHPFLAARVKMQEGVYDDIRFVYTPPTSVEDAILDASENLEYRTQSKDELISSYLNGPRTLSNERLSYLILSQPSSQLIPSPPVTPTLSSSSEDSQKESPSSEYEGTYDLLICAAHFLGDGMALHQFAHDFFTLLGSEKPQTELVAQLQCEWESCRSENVLPPCLEDNLPVRGSKFRRAAVKVEFQKSQDRLIGGQTLSRVAGRDRHTMVPTVSFDEERTKRMLKKCKENGVSISAALFALCNVVWARMASKRELPMMMYSALNLRPYFPLQPLHPSYWFLAVGYFNVILPSFLPSSCSAEQIFWHRARKAKAQSAAAAKNKLITERTQEMARERGARARQWGREDDEAERRERAKEAGVVLPELPKPQPQVKSNPKPPSQALIGLSLLGNLDGIYKHTSFPAIKMHTLTTGSRQRPGGMLLFGYTFVGKLWISLGYDVNGFGEDAGVFWEKLLEAVAGENVVEGEETLGREDN
ncbi:hypothetical protein NEOLEDRAFT_1144356 [Neolentinus lepideus HHB14362 ss-1]|uniref:Acyltransferase ChoActase/COT/CPT n=1 Tax=Neolentinus lepideus HHB14362 ss-1 TaxID=1314782 RepID=A0A165W881_9AGAM|nr:hypothetical protein NEOLEDRAFT_1144356 [Neolentinus lepideus HHB14362 ss-1]